jgi:NAD-dependent SIR2 family protein deacetylase
MKDKSIICIQCENPFVFSVSEQERFIASGFAIPKRCPECRKKKLKEVVVNEKWENKVRQKRVLKRNKHEFYARESE